MIVVIGSPAAVRAGKRVLPAGRSVAVAGAVRTAGADVQIVGKVADDLAGDAIVVELGRRSVGHAALARTGERTPIGDAPPPADEPPEDVVTEPSSEALEATERPAEPRGAKPPPEGLPLEPADLKLALGYLPEIGAIVVAAPLAADAAKVVADSAAYHEVPLVVLVDSGDSLPPAFEGSIVLEVPPEAADSFDRLVGVFVTRLEKGAEAKDALRDAVAAGGWERATD